MGEYEFEFEFAGPRTAILNRGLRQVESISIGPGVTRRKTRAEQFLTMCRGFKSPKPIKPLFIALVFARSFDKSGTSIAGGSLLEDQAPLPCALRWALRVEPRAISETLGKGRCGMQRGRGEVSGPIQSEKKSHGHKGVLMPSDSAQGRFGVPGRYEIAPLPCCQ